MLRDALDYAVGKLRAVAPGVTSFPEQTRFERWTYTDTGGWVGGFWPGLLWLAWLDSGDDEFRRLAEESCDRLAPRRDDTSTHDLGFLFYPSWVTGWRLTGDRRRRDGALRAAATMCRRFNPAGRYLRAWGELGTDDRAGKMIIDTMMNLDLLLWAGREGGDPRYTELAVAHAETTAARMVRPDGSTCHTFDHDPVTGAPLGPGTHQGYSATSCWSRGQAWALYGFTTVHRRTGRADFLDTARAVADHFVAHLPDDGVPFWDFASPYVPHDVRDSSAGAVAACGLLDLGTVTGLERYTQAATHILHGLADTCLTRPSARAEGVLTRATSGRPQERGIEVSLPYADYYFVEALLRVLRPDEVSQAVDLTGCDRPSCCAAAGTCPEVDRSP
jgi:unsaturated chondroitin disaccharide hydrolase